MDPTSLTGPVYTYSLSVKANKVSGSSIRDYIDANTQPGAAFNQAVAAADEAARASSAVKGKSIQDYVAANRGVFNFTASANGNDGQGKSIEQYVSGESGSSAASSASSAALLSQLTNTGTEQGKTFQDYLNSAEGTASSTASSAAATAEQQAAGSTTGKTIQNYFSAAQGITTP